MLKDGHFWCKMGGVPTTFVVKIVQYSNVFFVVARVTGRQCTIVWVGDLRDFVWEGINGRIMQTSWKGYQLLRYIA